ncbi:hypothetical protein GOBAR_DD12501 [Gossypium barbadense]|nr:hypothetical protein GOBAR_DD12501 [Gossypium barbadense]
MATATYPPPPPFYRLYKDYLQNPKSAPEPPPPIEGTCVCFGGNYTTDDVLPSLEDQGVRQLYPKGPNIFKKELRSLNRELQLHILELADVLVERPSQYARQVEEISLIFKNLHHLLNSLRPHQNFRYNGVKKLWRILRGGIFTPENVEECMSLAPETKDIPLRILIRRREEARRLLKESLGTLDGQ